MSKSLDIDEELEKGRKFGNQTFTKGDEINLLVITRGHPFERDPFFEMIDSLGFQWSHIEHPAAQNFFEADNIKKYNAILFYDMPGLNFESNPNEESFFVNPSEYFKKNFIDRLSDGIGCVFLHHSLAGWPLWDEYSEIVGGKFLYKPGKVRGVESPDSGYRHFVDYKVMPVGDHPITRGLEEFEIEDELYLAHVFEDSINPILKSNYSFKKDNFYSASNALAGNLNSNENWNHDDGSNLVGWTKNYKKSAITYLQFGDGVKSYKNENVRNLVRRSISWVIKETADLKK
ncbi:MAG: hypothetical protein HON61_01900 [Alphaproteobacteria bacterium]|nr:hypothetical protein [Alphaproteobacteria bacterium]